jgi:hypothetical protein
MPQKFPLRVEVMVVHVPGEAGTLAVPLLQSTVVLYNSIAVKAVALEQTT